MSEVNSTQGESKPADKTCPAVCPWHGTPCAADMDLEPDHGRVLHACEYGTTVGDNEWGPNHEWLGERAETYDVMLKFFPKVHSRSIGAPPSPGSLQDQRDGLERVFSLLKADYMRSWWGRRRWKRLVPEVEKALESRWRKP